MERIANAPESIAWLAMIAERMAVMKVGQNNGAVEEKTATLTLAIFSLFSKSTNCTPNSFIPGIDLKNVSVTSSGNFLRYAVCPM